MYGVFHPFQVEAFSELAPRAVGSNRQADIQNPLWSEPIQQSRFHAVPHASDKTLRRRRQAFGDFLHDLPVVLHALVHFENRRRVLGDVANGQSVKRQIEMIRFQRRGRWQDQIGMASCLVDIDVESYEEVESLQRAIQLPTVRSRENRVTRVRNQCSDCLLYTSDAADE